MRLAQHTGMWVYKLVRIELRAPLVCLKRSVQTLIRLTLGHLLQLAKIMDASCLQVLLDDGVKRLHSKAYTIYNAIISKPMKYITNPNTRPITVSMRERLPKSLPRLTFPFFEAEYDCVCVCVCV